MKQKKFSKDIDYQNNIEGNKISEQNYNKRLYSKKSVTNKKKQNRFRKLHLLNSNKHLQSISILHKQTLPRNAR